MIASIHYHSRGHDLLALAALCNDHATDDRFVYDLTGPATVNEWPGVTYLAIHRISP